MEMQGEMKSKECDKNVINESCRNLNSKLYFFKLPAGQQGTSIQRGILLSHKKETVPFGAIWMQLEVGVQDLVNKSKREKRKEPQHH